MLYIKEYNSFNLYQEISLDQAMEKRNAKFDDKIADQIIKIIKKNSIEDYWVNNENIGFNTDEVGVDIIYCDDEWFKVYILYFSYHATKVKSNNPYSGKQLCYFCDQYEGLLSLLKDKLEIKI